FRKSNLKEESLPPPFFRLINHHFKNIRTFNISIMNYQNINLSKFLAIPLLALGTISCEMNPMEGPVISEKSEQASNEMAAEEGPNLRVGGSILFEETFEGSNPFSTAH